MVFTKLLEHTDKYPTGKVRDCRDNLSGQAEARLKEVLHRLDPAVPAQVGELSQIQALAACLRGHDESIRVTARGLRTTAATKKTGPQAGLRAWAAYLDACRDLASSSLRSLMPACEASIERVSDSRASSGLWKPSEFSAVHHSQYRLASYCRS